MTFGFDDLQGAIVDWKTAYLPDKDFHDPIIERICQILKSVQAGASPSDWTGDLIPLVRHYLLNEGARHHQDAHLRVPSLAPWPAKSDWERHSIDVLPAGENAYILTARGWFPDWLGTCDDGVFHDAFTDKQVRTPGACEADPFISEATKFESYSSPGQREAVRAVFLMNPGETLLVNLPTGSGKSLVGQAPALVDKLEGSLTIFVVPTVALAIDQARAMSAFIRATTQVQQVWPLAWFGGLDKEQRAEIRARLRDGTQRILFTSPEALTTTLLSAVTEAAKAGMLKYLVIDEAHLITQWGDEFRPSFQALAGLRNNLSRVSPHGFRTVLLSATFTQETVETLAHLFGATGRVHMVAAVHLRPEPQYWFHQAASKEEKQVRVLEALRHAPRPFILYVTTRDDIREWNAVLRANGLRRLACFDGGTGPTERKRIIDDWVTNRLDGIVATSAFGVGIDKADVRTVIHAAIPETLDRYYQEVGRGGRDGRPSISLLVYDKSHWALPERLARPRIVTEELGISRWEAMYRTRRKVDGDNLLAIQIDALRRGLSSGNEYNVSWNMRTLILMVRAGLIELDVEPVERADDNEALEQEGGPLLAAMASVRVRIKNDGHLLLEEWEKHVTVSREKTLRAAERNLELMQGLLNGTKEVGETLVELYSIGTHDWYVPVTRVCGGCPKDRFISDATRTYSMPVPAPLAMTRAADFAPWRARFPWIDPSFVYVFYDDENHTQEWRQGVIRIAGWLVQECGVREVGVQGDAALARNPEWLRLYRRASGSVVLHRDRIDMACEPYTPLARVSVLGPTTDVTDLEQLQLLQRPFHIILLPKRFPDPMNDQRRLADISVNKAHLHQILSEIRQ